MRLSASAAFLICSLFLGAADRARADAIAVGGGWQSFSWTGAPNAQNQEGAFTFTSTMQTRVTVTDAFIDGDRFQVFDGGTSLGLTSHPTDDGTNIGTNPDAALANPKFSSGTFLLQPGSHSITLEVTAIATGFPGGSAYLRVDPVTQVVPTGQPSDTPEPGSLTLIAAAAVCLACFGWCRRGRYSLFSGTYLRQRGVARS